MAAQEQRQQTGTEFRIYRYPTVGVFIIALITRGIYLAEQMAHPEFMIPVIDAATYHTFAAQWVAEGLRDSTTAWHGTFYPVFLSLVYLITGPSVLWAKIIQLMIGAAACGGIASITRRLYGTHAAWISGIFAALYGPLIFYESELVPAGWSVAWSVAILGHLTSGGLFETKKRGLLTGIIAGGSALTRPELFAGFLAAMLVSSISDCMRKKETRPRMAPALTGLAAFMLLTLPVGFLNERFTGNRSWLPANGSLNLYLGNSEAPCETLSARPGPDYDRLVNAPETQGAFTTDERSAYYIKEVRGQFHSTPLQTIKTLLWKAGMLVAPREITADLDVYTARESSLLLQALVWKTGRFGFPFGLLLPLALVGLAHPSSRALRLPILACLAAAALMILFHPAARYRLVLLPTLFVLASAGWTIAASRIRERQFGLPAIGAAGVILLTAIPITCIEATDFTAERYRMIAQRTQDPERAAHWLERAYQRNSRDPQILFMFALREAEANQPDKANVLLDNALAITPDYIMALVLKAELAEKRNDTPSALELLRRAVTADPDNHTVHYRLAIIEAEHKNFTRAIYHMEQALRFGPPIHERTANFAALLIDSGAYGRAATLLEQLLAANPDDPGLHVNMAISMRELNQPDQAAAHLTKALSLSSGDAQAEAWIREQMRQLQNTKP